MIRTRVHYLADVVANRNCQIQNTSQTIKTGSPVGPKLQIPFATWWSSCVWRPKPSLINKLTSKMISLPPNTPQSISQTALRNKILKMQFSRWPPGAILDLKVETRSNDETDITNQFFGPKYPISHKSHITMGQIVENVIFKMAAGCHIGFRAPQNSAHTFASVTLAKFVI